MSTITLDTLKTGKLSDVNRSKSKNKARPK